MSFKNGCSTSMRSPTRAYGWTEPHVAGAHGHRPRAYLQLGGSIVGTTFSTRDCRYSAIHRPGQVRASFAVGFAPREAPWRAGSAGQEDLLDARARDRHCPGIFCNRISGAMAVPVFRSKEVARGFAHPRFELACRSCASRRLPRHEPPYRASRRRIGSSTLRRGTGSPREPHGSPVSIAAPRRTMQDGGLVPRGGLLAGWDHEAQPLQSATFDEAPWRAGARWH